MHARVKTVDHVEKSSGRRRGKTGFASQDYCACSILSYAINVLRSYYNNYSAPEKLSLFCFDVRFVGSNGVLVVGNLWER